MTSQNYCHLKIIYLIIRFFKIKNKGFQGIHTERSGVAIWSYRNATIYGISHCGKVCMYCIEDKALLVDSVILCCQSDLVLGTITFSSPLPTYAINYGMDSKIHRRGICFRSLYHRRLSSC